LPRLSAEVAYGYVTTLLAKTIKALEAHKLLHQDVELNIRDAVTRGYISAEYLQLADLREVDLVDDFVSRIEERIVLKAFSALPEPYERFAHYVYDVLSVERFLKLKEGKSGIPRDLDLETCIKNEDITCILSKLWRDSLEVVRRIAITEGLDCSRLAESALYSVFCFKKTLYEQNCRKLGIRCGPFYTPHAETEGVARYKSEAVCRRIDESGRRLAAENVRGISIALLANTLDELFREFYPYPCLSLRVLLYTIAEYLEKCVVREIVYGTLILNKLKH